MLNRDFVPAAWHGTTASDGEVIGISLEVDGGVARFSMPVDSALKLAESILGHVRTSSQSESSSSIAGAGDPLMEQLHQWTLAQLAQ